MVGKKALTTLPSLPITDKDMVAGKVAWSVIV
jgi:hypothetical protein